MNESNSCTIRVTSILETYKSGKMRFAGVSVCPSTFETKEDRARYRITALPHQVGFEPSLGQVWTISGVPYIDYEPSHRFTGKMDTIYEYQNPEKVNCLLPRTAEAFAVFIGIEKEFKGVTPSKVAKLWDTYGEKTLNYMKHARADKLVEVEDVTDVTAKTLIEGFEKYRNIEYSKWMVEREIPLDVQKKIFDFKPILCEYRTLANRKSFSIDPRSILEENPYRLCSTFDMPFFEVDKLVRRKFETDLKSTDARRMVAVVKETIKEVSANKHTVVTRRQLFNKLEAKLGSAELIAELLAKDDNQDYQKTPHSLLATAALELHDKEAYFKYPNSDFYTLSNTYLFENVVAMRLLLMNKDTVAYSDAEVRAWEEAFEQASFPLNKLQKKAVKMAVSNRICCISGGAGTGKTTVLHTVLTAYEELGYVSNINLKDFVLSTDRKTELFCNRNVKAIALTNRAAKRMSNSINKADELERQRPIQTSSIARFLHNTVIDDGQGKYLLVIDEASMLDLNTMFQIVTNIHYNVRLLLVGDHHQLPPITAGKIFADIIHSGVIPNVELTEVVRSSDESGIPAFSRDIRDGIVPNVLFDTRNVRNKPPIHFHEVASDEIAETSAKLYQQSPGNSMIVGSLNTLVDEVNLLCQELVNEDGEPFSYSDTGKVPDFAKKILSGFRKNDPILFLVNDTEAGIQNGSLGKLVSVQQEKGTFGSITLDDEDHTVKPSIELLQDLKLGYSLTVHKAQGSQFPRVIVALKGGSFFDRAWLYTAATRAEVEVHIVCTKEKLISTIKNKPNADTRQTMLKQLLQEGAQSNLIFDV